MVKVTKKNLADLLGYSERTLTDWQAEGLPIEQAGARGQEHVYDTAAVVAWLLERTARKIRGESPRDEYLRSQTKLNDIKIAEAEGRLAPVDEIEREITRMVIGARQRLLQIPVTLTDALEGLEAGARSELIAKAINEALMELSVYASQRGELDA